MYQQLIKYLDSHHIEYKINVSMSEKTWIHRGPLVPIYILPYRMDDLSSVIKYIIEKKLDYLVVGHTSNIYMKESFKTDVVISTAKMTTFLDCDTYILCDAGVNISKLSKYCVERGYSGFEGLVGLPGTVGGALVNNSSCFECSVSDLLLDAEILLINFNGECEIKKYLPLDFKFQHRSSTIKRKEIQAVVLRIKLNCKKTNDVEKLRTKAKQNIEERKNTQEGKANNLGSIYSGYKPYPLSLKSLGGENIVRVICFRIWDHFNRYKEDYFRKKLQKLLSLYDYRDLERYISKKNINCFIWKDKGADKAFNRYQEFMHRYAKCEPMEIEIYE